MTNNFGEVEAISYQEAPRGDWSVKCESVKGQGFGARLDFAFTITSETKKGEKFVMRQNLKGKTPENQLTIYGMLKGTLNNVGVPKEIQNILVIPPSPAQFNSLFSGKNFFVSVQDGQPKNGGGFFEKITIKKCLDEKPEWKLPSDSEIKAEQAKALDADLPF